MSKYFPYIPKDWHQGAGDRILWCTSRKAMRYLLERHLFETVVFQKIGPPQYKLFEIFEDAVAYLEIIDE